MATLEEFLRTGHLGPVILGMTPTDVMTTLGDPQDISRKTNPLQLKYGCARLSFWKAQKHQAPHLRGIVIAYQPEFEPLPETLAFADWNQTEPPTEQQFRSFINKIGYMPARLVEGPSSREITFLSGVTALVSGEMLHSIRLLQRETKESLPISLADEREPTIKQILDMHEEADRAMQIGAYRAALLLAWAGLEATLRRAALRAGRQGKIGAQPSILIRELFSAGQLTPAEHALLEELRQMRTSLAHGLAPTTVDVDAVHKLSDLSKRLLGTID